MKKTSAINLYTLPGILCAFCVAILPLNRLPAQVTNGNSYGYGVAVDTDADATLTLLTLSIPTSASIAVGPLPATATGSAPVPYNTGLQSVATPAVASLAALNLNLVLASATSSVNLATATGVFNGQADSTVDLSVGSKLAHGFGQVQNLSLNILDLGITATDAAGVNISVNPPPLISFTQVGNALLTSDSTVTGVPNLFSPTGTSTIADLSISINGGAATSLSALATAAGISYTLSGGALVGVPINSVITLGVNASGGLPGLGGGLISLDANTQLRLVLNEQILDGGDPNFSPRITTTAIHLELTLPDSDLATALSVATLDVDADVDVWLAQSQAQLIGVPEPSTFALLGLGALGLAWKVTRHRKA